MQELASGTTAVEAANSLLNDHEVGDMNPFHLAKVPVQERGKTRFNGL